MLVYSYSRIEILVDVSTSDHHLLGINLTVDLRDYRLLGINLTVDLRDYRLLGNIILGSRNVETVQFLTDRPDNNASNSSILSVVSFLKPFILSKSVYVQDLLPNE